MVLKVYRFQKGAFLLTVHGFNWRHHRRNCRIGKKRTNWKCGPMPNVMAALPNIGGALCSV